MAMKFDLVDGIVVSVMRGPTGDPEWGEYARFLGDTFRKTERSRGLMVADAGPSPTQRALLDTTVRRHSKSFRLAVVSNSAVVRGLVASMSASAPAYRSFDPADMARALEHLDAPVQRHGAIIAQVNVWCGEIGMPQLPPVSHRSRPATSGLLR